MARFLFANGYVKPDGHGAIVVNQKRSHHNQEPKVIAMAAAQEKQDIQTLALSLAATLLFVLSLCQLQ